MKYKRYCKTLFLENDSQLIEAYKKVHAAGASWPEITEGMKAVGILDMEIYIHGNILFMIMDTVPEFDHDRDMKRLAAMPRQSEWEAHVSQYQQSSENASADEKWQLMERIFEMDQREVYSASEGQLKKND